MRVQLMYKCNLAVCVGVLLVVGGIGVTPARAMLDVCLRRNYLVTIVYAVRTLADAAFLGEFEEVLVPASYTFQFGELCVMMCLH